MISNILILIIFKCCYSLIKYTKFEKGKTLRLYFQTHEENYVSLDYDADFEISDTSQFTSHYYLIFSNKLRAICKVKLEDLPEDSFNQYNKSDCEIIEFNEKYNILKYEKITNKSLKNAFIFYPDYYEYISSTFEIKKLSIPFRLDNKSHTYNAKGNEIKIFFTQLKDVRNNFYLFLISKSNRVSVFAQDLDGYQGSYKKINIINNTIFKLYNSNEDNYYFDNQFIILIYHNIFSYEESINIGMKVINRNENINVFNLKSNENSIMFSCINKNIFILNTNNSNSVILSINFDIYKSFKYYKNNKLERFDDLEKSENFEELVNNNYYTNNYAIFSVECVKNEFFKLNYTYIKSKYNNQIITHKEYFYFELQQYRTTFQIDQNLVNNDNDIILLLLSDNTIKLHVDYSKQIELKKNEKTKFKIYSKYFTIYYDDYDKFNSIIALKVEIPKNLIDIIEDEINSYEIKITSYEKEKYVIFFTSEEFFKRHSQKQFIVSSSMIEFNVYIDSGYKEIDEIPINLKYYHYNETITSLLDFERLKSNNFKYSFNKYFYKLFYFPNLQKGTKYYFKIIYYNEVKNDTFNKLTKKDNNKNNEIFKFINSFKGIFFIYPCTQINLKIGENNNTYYSKPSFFRNSIKSDQILSHTGEGFISYHIYDEYDYLNKNFTYNYSILNDTSLEIIDKKTLRFSFPLFSLNEDINYYLVIANKKYYEDLSYDCNFLEKFYTNYEENYQIERYYFHSKNLINHNNMTSFITLNLQNTIDIVKERKNLIYRLMGISKSEVPYVKFYPLSNTIKTKVFYFMDYLLYIVISIIIIILLVICICRYCCKDDSNKLHYTILSMQELRYKNLLS